MPRLHAGWAASHADPYFLVLGVSSMPRLHACRMGCLPCRSRWGGLALIGHRAESGRSRARAS
eukprot:scaffold70470_cov18-Tisochrysis_lutea.AAC.4